MERHYQDRLNCHCFIVIEKNQLTVGKAICGVYWITLDQCDQLHQGAPTNYSMLHFF